MARTFTPPTREDALKVAKYLGCRGVHQDADGNWLPCSDAETLNRISNEAESKSSEKKKKRVVRRYLSPGYEKLGERGVLGIDTLAGGGLVSGKFLLPEEYVFEEDEFLDLKANSYTKPELRERIKNRIMAGSRGGKPGQWSARKAQLLALEYRRAGGGYRGGKEKPQRSLDKWTRERWTTSDGKPAIRKGGTNRYLPEKAWDKLTPAQREATNRKKRAGSKRGQQFIANTERARDAGRSVRNSQKSIIVGRARPRKGDPDVFDNANAARLRARTLGCIGIARRTTPDGETVWTPCTNVSDYRRQTGQSILAERDEIRRLQRRLREVGGPSFTRRRLGSSSEKALAGKLRSLADISGSRLGPLKQGSRFLGRRGRCRNITMIDRDNDGKICNPLTGRDELPVNPKFMASVDPVLREKLQRNYDQVQPGGSKSKSWAKQIAQPMRVTTELVGAKYPEVKQMLTNLQRRGFRVYKTDKGWGVEAGPKFQKLFLMRFAAGKRLAIDPGDDIGEWHKNTGHSAHGKNVNPGIFLANWALQNYGYDPKNDILFDFYDDHPETYEDIIKPKGDVGKRALLFTVDETDDDFLTDDERRLGEPKEIVSDQDGASNPLSSGQPGKLPEIQSYSNAGARKRKKIEKLQQERAVVVGQRGWAEQFESYVELGQRLYGDLDPERELSLEDDDFFNAFVDIDRAGLTYDEAAIFFNTTPERMLALYQENGLSDRPSPLPEYWAPIYGKDPGNSDVPDWVKKRYGTLLKQARQDYLAKGKNSGPAREEVARNENPVRGIPFLQNPHDDRIKREEVLAYRDFLIRNINNPQALREAALQHERFAAFLYTRDRNYFNGTINKNNVFGSRHPKYASSINDGSFERAQNRLVIDITKSLVNELKQGRLPAWAKDFGISRAQWQMILHVMTNHNQSYAEAVKTLKNLGLEEAFLRAKKIGVIPTAKGMLREISPQQLPKPADFTPPGPKRPAVVNVARQTGLIPPPPALRIPPPPGKKTAFVTGLERKVFRSLGRRVANSGVVRRGRRFIARQAPFKQNARDADMDNVVQEGTVHERPAGRGKPIRRAARAVAGVPKQIRKRRQGSRKLNVGGNDLIALLNRLRDPDGGFTVSLSNMDDFRSGWAIARRGQGVRVARDKIYDANGNVKPEGVDHLQAFLEMQKDKFTERGDKQRQVALGAWHNPETGDIYFDVTDVYAKRRMSVDEAVAEAKKQNQISIADLDELTAAVANNDWDKRQPFHQGGGDGSDVISDKTFGPFVDQMRQRRTNPKDTRMVSEDQRVLLSDDNVAMMIAEPDKDLASKHGVQKDWATIRALPQPERQRIADFYDDAPEPTAEEIQAEVRKAYEDLVKEVEQQFDMLTKELRVQIEFVDEDPYENYFEMLNDFRQNRRLKILKTSVTGGHPFMTDEQNDKFRAVHDAFGHLATGRGFDRHGEEAAFQAHKSMFSASAVKAATTELRGQNAFLIERGFFGPQKLLILPEEMRKFLHILLGFKVSNGSVRMNAQEWSDSDNAYTKTGSHHVSCGRSFK